MRLIIDNPDALDLEGFCNFVSAKLHIYSKDESLRTAGMDTLWNNYFKELYGSARKVPTIADLLESYFTNMMISQLRSSYLITADTSQKIFGVNESTEQLSRIVNYGASDMPAYPIFDKIYNMAADNLQTLYQQWEDS